MDISTLVSFLVPCLPFLIKAGEKVSEEAGKQLGSDVWAKAKEIWNKLQPKIDKEPSIQTAIADVAAEPEDEDCQAALRVQLKKLFAREIVLSDEIERLMKNDSSDSAPETQINQTITGNENKTIGQAFGDVKM